MSLNLACYVTNVKMNNYMKEKQLMKNIKQSHFFKYIFNYFKYTIFYKNALIS